MKQDHIERELQFDAPDIQAVVGWIDAQPAYASISITPKSDRTQQDTYFDSADWAIYRAGYSLRLRRFDERGEATLKALSKRSEGSQERRELNQSVSDLDGGWQKESGPVVDRVRLMAGGQEIRPLFSILTRRRAYLLRREADALAELSVDEAAIQREDVAPVRLHRVEIEELRDSGLESVQALVDALREACDLHRAETSKFEEGLQAAGLVPEVALSFGYADLTDDATAGEYAYALLRRYTADFLRHEPGTRLGEDPEELHQMRVATRRLRAAMSTFKAVLPLRFEGYSDDLQGVAGRLGEVRDFDVQMEALEAERARSDWNEGLALGPILEELAGRRATARSGLLETLDGERYRTLVQELTGSLREGDAGFGKAALPIRSFGARVLKKRYRQFRQQAKALAPESEDALYHAARIHGKRLRYALDALQPVFGRPEARVARSMRDVQDLLGEIQDCRVTIEWLRDMAATRGASWPPATLMKMGELLERRRFRKAELRAQWPDAFDEVKKRWSQLQKRMGRVSISAAPAEESEVPLPEVRPPVQRSFWMFRPFLRRRSK